MPNPSPSPSRFSDRETEEYCDAEDALFRSFGDVEGSLHWGAFEASEGLACGLPSSTSNVRVGFLAACSRPKDAMRETQAANQARAERFGARSDAWLKMVKAVGNEELGWTHHPRVK